MLEKQWVVAESRQQNPPKHRRTDAELYAELTLNFRVVSRKPRSG